jgi:orotidine-5'-phosphate decarboxylase
MKDSPVFCAIDTPDLGKAEKLAQQLRGHVHGLKLGLEFFMAHGAAGYNKVTAGEHSVFLDVKLHDIPNTVAGALSALLPLKPGFVTVHTSGGPAMMKAAVDAAKKAGGARPKLLGVTALTSLNAADLGAVGQDTNVGQQVMRLAELAKECGLDGVVCSPEEVKDLRAALGLEFILMVPGIRPKSAAADDQKRVMTPREAVDAGATYLVIGRPITAAADPVKAVQTIAAELAG